MTYYRSWCREVCKFSSKLYITKSALTQHGYRNGFEGLDESELRNIRKKGRRERREGVLACQAHIYHQSRRQ